LGVFVEGPKTWLFPVAAQTKSLPFSQGYVIMQCFFHWQIFAEFRPEKYDFDLYTRFFMESLIQIRQILTTIFFFQVARFLS
jgi:hypothetical protein